jgi:hypothetical protein|tara:strand:+ start:7521 stop:7811 length:291 start_codon:yes stop_codon:yes gene_type:complete
MKRPQTTARAVDSFISGADSHQIEQVEKKVVRQRKYRRKNLSLDDVSISQINRITDEMLSHRLVVTDSDVVKAALNAFYDQDEQAQVSELIKIKAR